MTDEVAKAKLGLAHPSQPQKFKNGTEFPVHFNPPSLQFTIKNTLKEGQGKSKKQYISQTSGQLTMDLVFDSTLTGADVRQDTKKVADFLQPEGKSKAPPIVQFEWGTFIFRGMVESFKETIDFFAPNGVPLRSTVSLGLASQDKVFDTTVTGKDAPQPVQVNGSPSLDPTTLAQRAGDPAAARNLAKSNNQESLRFASGPLTVEAGVTLNGPVAFAGASAGAGLGIGGGIGGSIGGGAGLSIGGGGGIGIGAAAGAGIGIGAGVRAGVSAGVSASAGVFAGASAGAGAFAGAGASATVSGSTASFGVSAAQGAFANLHTQSVTRAVSLDPSQLLDNLPAPDLATDSGASFGVGGRATVTGSASLTADVGAAASVRGSIRFDP